MPYRSFSVAALLLALSTQWFGSALRAADHGRSLDERIASVSWKKVRGVNYIPSYGRNNYEIWRDYNHDAFDTELRLVKKVGYNSIRLWLTYFAYAEGSDKFLDSVEDAIKLCRKHGLKAVVVLFDGCGNRPRDDAETMSIAKAYGQFTTDPHLSEDFRKWIAFNYKPYAQGPGKDILIPVAADTPPHIMLWQQWQPSPGYDKMGEDWWPKLDQYVQAVVGRLAGDETVLVWDLMNEPEWSSEEPIQRGLQNAEVRERVMKFLGHVRDVIKKDHPDEPVTIGFASIDSTRMAADLADVLTFHAYSDDPAKVRENIEKARKVGREIGKPIFNTETLANFQFGPYDIAEMATDEGQLEHYKKMLPVWLEADMGWMAWGMIVGRIFDSYTDIFYANGHPRPAALYLEKELTARPADLE